MFIDLGLGYLFSQQVIPFSAAHRRACYGMIARAIEDAVAMCAAATATGGVHAAVHPTNTDADVVDAQFRQLVVAAFGSVADSRSCRLDSCRWLRRLHRSALSGGVP